MAISKLLPQALGLPATARRRSTLGLWMHGRVDSRGFWLTMILLSVLCGGGLGAFLAYGSQAGQRVCERDNAHLLSRDTLKARSLGLNSHQIACFDDRGRLTIHETGE